MFIQSVDVRVQLSRLMLKPAIAAGFVFYDLYQVVKRDTTEGTLIDRYAINSK